MSYLLQRLTIRLGHRWRSLLVFLGVLGACGRDPEIRPLSIDDPEEYWHRGGFMLLASAARLPSSSPEVDQVGVWLRVPEGATIATQPLPADAGRRASRTLRLPPGSEIDRIEYAEHEGRRFVADVRGARVDLDGTMWFRVLRPWTPAAEPRVFGLEWPRASAKAHAKATDRLIEQLTHRPPAVRMRDDQRERFLASVRQKNQCDECHMPLTSGADADGRRALMHRDTDADGFYVPATVLEDEVVLESYGKYDRTLQDSFVILLCGQQTVTAAELHRRRCPDGSAPRARIDWARAHTEDSKRAAQICAARRYLVERLDAAGREAFAHALDPCPPPQP